MGFFSFIVLLAIAYLVWRVTDQLPDLIFRLSEIQRDVAEMRRRLVEQGAAGDATRPGPVTPPPTGSATAPPTAGPATSSPGTVRDDSATPGGSSGGPVHGGETGADYTRS